MKKNIPKFRSPEEAALFWESHEVLDYVEADEFKIVPRQERQRYAFVNPNQKKEKQLVSLRIDSDLLGREKRVASRCQVGYQSILRKWLEKGAPHRAT